MPWPTVACRPPLESVAYSGGIVNEAGQPGGELGRGPVVVDLPEQEPGRRPQRGEPVRGQRGPLTRSTDAA